MYNYTYNGLGNIEGEKRNGATFKSLEYDRHNRLAETTIHTSDETLVYTPIYETRDSDGAIYADNAIKGMTLNGIFEQSVDKDEHGRPIRTALNVGECNDELLASEYEYLTSENRLTGIVDSVTHKVNGYLSDKFKYTYDANGNITAVSIVTDRETDTKCEYDECGNPICITTETDKTEPIAEYIYDGLNRLTRENNYVLGKTYTYKYDAAGNILSKITYNVTSGALVTPTDVKLYKYAADGWKDKLTSYDGVSITYDSMGNPTSYRGHSLEWGRIRLLTKWDNTEMEYNASGLRTRKGDTYYELDGSTIISETTCGDTIRYYYGNGGIVGFRYNGSRYYYEKNLMGDIVGIYDTDGNKVGGYTYDAWGNCTITTNINNLANVNPFRYRGYYYDSETGLYCVSSRYYDPDIGRWITPEPNVYKGKFDEGCNLLAYNVYAYCANNPVLYIDYNGESIFLALAIGFGIGALISGASKLISNHRSGKEWYDGLAISMLAGGVGGAISCISIPGVSSWVCAAVFGGVGNIATNLILGEINSIEDLASALTIGVGAGLLGNASAQLLIKGVTNHFGSLTKHEQKAFLSRIGHITNSQLTSIRQEMKQGLTPEILTDLVEKYGYDVLVSAFVSSTASSIP